MCSDACVKPDRTDRSGLAPIEDLCPESWKSAEKPPGPPHPRSILSSNQRRSVQPAKSAFNSFSEESAIIRLICPIRVLLFRTNQRRSAQPAKSAFYSSIRQFPNRSILPFPLNSLNSSIFLPASFFPAPGTFSHLECRAPPPPRSIGAVHPEPPDARLYIEGTALAPPCEHRC